MVICRKCGKEKDEDKFYRDNRLKTGINQPCIDCCKRRANAQKLARIRKMMSERDSEDP